MEGPEQGFDIFSRQAVRDQPWLMGLVLSEQVLESCQTDPVLIGQDPLGSALLKPLDDGLYLILTQPICQPPGRSRLFTTTHTDPNSGADLLTSDLRAQLLSASLQVNTEVEAVGVVLEKADWQTPFYDYLCGSRGAKSSVSGGSPSCEEKIHRPERIGQASLEPGLLCSGQLGAIIRDPQVGPNTPNRTSLRGAGWQ